MLGFLKRVKASVDARRLRRLPEDDRTPGAFAELCRRLIGQGRWDDALGVAKEGVRRFPRFAELQDQARLLWMREERATRRELEGAFESSPGEESGAALVEHLLDAGELEFAVAAAERAAALAPASADAAVDAFEARVRRFERDLTAADGAAALAWLRRATELRPDDADLRARAGELLVFIGAAGAARAAFEAADAMRQGDAEVARRLAELPTAAIDEPESELLDRVELEDRPAALWRRPTDEAEAARRKVATLEDLERFAKSPDVCRAAWVTDEMSAIANLDGAREAGPGDDVFVGLAATFRPQFAVAVKRLGAGALQEAELSSPNSRVMVFAGPGGLLAVDHDHRRRPEPAAARSREFVVRNDPTLRGGRRG